MNNQGPINSENVNIRVDENNRITLELNKPKKWKSSTKALVGIISIAVVLGVTLLAYMHISGLGITKTGFTTLGKEIAEIWKTTHHISNAQIAYGIVAPVVGSIILISVVAVLAARYRRRQNERETQRELEVQQTATHVNAIIQNLVDQNTALTQRVTNLAELAREHSVSSCQERLNLIDANAELTQRIQQNGADIQNLRQRNDELTQQIQQNEAQAQNLTEQNIQLTQQIAQKENEVQNLTQQIAQLNEQIQQHRAQAQTSTVLGQEVTQLRKDVLSLGKDKTTCMQQILELNQEISKNLESIKLVTKDNEDLTVKNNELNKVIETQAEQMGAIAINMQNLRKQIGELGSDHASKIESLQKENERQVVQVQNLNKEKSEWNLKYNQAGIEIGTLQRENQVQKQLLLQMSDTISQCAQNSLELQKQIEQQKSERELSERKVEELQIEVEYLKRINLKMSKENNITNSRSSKEITKLNNEINELLIDLGEMHLNNLELENKIRNINFIDNMFITNFKKLFAKKTINEIDFEKEEVFSNFDEGDEEIENSEGCNDGSGVEVNTDLAVENEGFKNNMDEGDEEIENSQGCNDGSGVEVNTDLAVENEDFKNNIHELIEAVDNLEVK